MAKSGTNSKYSFREYSAEVLNVLTENKMMNTCRTQDRVTYCLDVERFTFYPIVLRLKMMPTLSQLIRYSSK